MKKAKRRRAPRTREAALPPGGEARLEEAGRERSGSPRLTGGDVDADWRGAESAGEEAVGGTVATPDQDVVDEIGRAVGVEQDPAAEVRASEEILAERDRRRWQLEWEAAQRQRPP
jgi:hypothetical protein